MTRSAILEVTRKHSNDGNDKDRRYRRHENASHLVVELVLTECFDLECEGSLVAVEGMTRVVVIMVRLYPRSSGVMFKELTEMWQYTSIVRPPRESGYMYESRSRRIGRKEGGGSKRHTLARVATVGASFERSPAWAEPKACRDQAGGGGIWQCSV